MFFAPCLRMDNEASEKQTENSGLTLLAGSPAPVPPCQKYPLPLSPVAVIIKEWLLCRLPLPALNVAWLMRLMHFSYKGMWLLM